VRFVAYDCAEGAGSDVGSPRWGQTLRDEACLDGLLNHLVFVIANAKPLLDVLATLYRHIHVPDPDEYIEQTG
jgi:hypothetical protein